MAEKPPIDLLQSFGRFGRKHKLSLRDPNALKAFMADVERTLTGALRSDTLLHGQRIENMFEALMVSLGHYSLFKREDVGTVYPTKTMQAPDFRAHLPDGTPWLIEVKNVYCENPQQQVFEVTRDYMARLQNYASATHAPLKFALYWARWRLWTIVDASGFEEAGDKLKIEMLRAIAVNELAELGDRAIGTAPPLRFRLTTDPSKKRTVGPDGETSFTIGHAAFYSGDQEITDPIEQQIAWILANFGDWESEGPEARITSGLLDAIELTWTPRERANPTQQFEMIGTLSSMFSRHYASHTLNEEGVIQTEADLIPGWFAPLLDPHYKSKSLPLWRFVLHGRPPLNPPLNRRL
jgi:hypothetical protein